MLQIKATRNPHTTPPQHLPLQPVLAWPWSIPGSSWLRIKGHTVFLYPPLFGLRNDSFSTLISFFFFFFKLTPLWRLIALSCKGEKINSCWSMAGRCFFSWSLICYLFSIFEIKILLQSPQIAENTPLLPSLRSLLPPIRAWHYQRCAFCFAFRVVWKFWAVNNVPVWLGELFRAVSFSFFFPLFLLSPFSFLSFFLHISEWAIN